MTGWLELTWWVLWVAAFGAAMGSFANVLVHRLPRGRVLTPLWSFCPLCERRILLRDNLPLVSFLLRRGRCRYCRGPISIRYPLIEAVTILAFLLVFDGMFVAAVRPDITGKADFGLTDRVVGAWPMLVAHLALVAGLVVVSVIDLEEYWVDLRMIAAILVAGLIGHALWTPSGEGVWQPPGPATGAACFGALAGLGVSLLCVRLLRPAPTAVGNTSLTDTEPVAEHGDATEPCAAASEAAAQSQPLSCEKPVADVGSVELPPLESGGQTAPPSAPDFRPMLLPAWLLALLTLGWLSCILLGELSRQTALTFWRRSSWVVGLLFAAEVLASARRRESDRAIVAAIEQEKHRARSMALRELLFLVPAVALAALAAYIAGLGFGGRLGWHSWYLWSAGDEWLPIAGLCRSLLGALVAGGLGWAVRILFTFLLGKEAFGLGDVYIMAAAGAVAGWAVVILGFFAAALLALLGVLLLLVFKRSRAIPFGPWLSLGILILVVAYRPLRDYLEPGLKGLAILTGLSSPSSLSN